MKLSEMTRQNLFVKKNINLKFSRMLTIFSTILPIISKRQCSKEDVLSLCKQTPLERLAGFDAFLNRYEFFLNQKENMLNKPAMATKEKKVINAKATKFSGFLYRSLNHHKIPEEYRRYLVL